MIEYWNRVAKRMLIVALLLMILSYPSYKLYGELPLKSASESFRGNTVTVKFPNKFDNMSSGISLRAGTWTCWDNSGFFRVTFWQENASIYSTSIEEYMSWKKEFLGHYRYSDYKTRTIDGKEYYEYTTTTESGREETHLVNFSDGYLVVMDYATKGYCPNKEFQVEKYYERIINSIKHS